MKQDIDNSAQTVTEKYQAGKGVNDLWMTFNNSLSTTTEENIRIFVLKQSSSLPWFNAQLKKMLKRKRRLFPACKGFERLVPLPEVPKRRELRRAEWQYINKNTQEGLDKNDTRPFWRFIEILEARLL